MEREYNLVSIDAMHDGEGWYWNNIMMHENHTIDDNVMDSPTKLLKYCRDNGLLTEYSKGKCYVQNDSEIVEIRTRSHEPRIAFQLVN